MRAEEVRRGRLLAGWRGRTAIVAAVLAALALGFPAAARWAARAPDLAWISQADALGARLAVSLGVQAAAQPQILSAGIAAAPGYRDPLRAVSGLVPERIDMGVDFSGTGPVYALGDGVVLAATAVEPGWPGGGWITYQLTDGPDAGLVIFVAENVTPAVQAGQTVTPETIIGTMYSGGDGIETGWAQPGGQNAESQLPAAGGIGGLGPFPTRIGASFDAVLISVGVPPAPNLGQVASGLLPAGYPEG